MQRVAVFGNAGGGKSTLARKLSALTGLPLYPLDLVAFKAGGGAVPRDEYLRAHAEILEREAWIIDGYGTAASTFERLAVADTLIYVDLPRFTHYRWVLKRFAKSLLVKPESWPDDPQLWASTLSGLRVVGSCHRHLTPKYRALVTEAAGSKRVHHLRSPRQIRAFLTAVEKEQQPSS
jgi:adenylate kinase family enzyme